ncbi:thiol-disulfide oxidoreductase ResA [Salipaludibacillus sp. CUR1]|uniref:thiol-disulfide oxidoreductase ResA n=1 Tax=Salipaludibacillus sp. CUR1 TaxID=2820003 RepID=UPI001E34CAFC|nr:thiol-disulfide oxidoreductase ResA [Salipaludibacillus sp. CUR1]MCE7793966.1 thiol-disulfide oxidoreductase ResA [Salipaludibacillus sp. CUR1]
MKQRRLIIRSTILLVMVAAIGYTFYSHFSEDRGLVNAGDEAPDFVLKDVNGEEVHLEDYEGQGVYLTFWATYCTYCRNKMEYLKDHYDEYKEKGVEIIGVNVNESSVQVQRFIDRHNVPYPNPIDRDMLVGNAYGVTSLPHTLLIDEDGMVIERTIGGKTEADVVASLDKIVPGS